MWNPPEIWKGGECWIIGGGPSVPKIFDVPQHLIEQVYAHKESPAVFAPYMKAIHDRHIIGVNASFLLGDWIDFLFFGDYKFLVRYQEALAATKMVKVSCHRKTDQYKDIKYMPMDTNHIHGISKRRGFVSWNMNSGAASISLAVQLGVKRIYLLGFDMNAQHGERHWHKLYKIKAKKPPFQRHLKGFYAIAHEAKELGVEIINVNPSSAIDTLPKKTLKECI